MLVVILLSLTLTPEVRCAPPAVPSVLVPALLPAVTHIPPQGGDQTVHPDFSSIQILSKLLLFLLNQ